MERVIEEALARVPMRMLCYAIMPTHWHFVLWPRHDGELSAFMNWLTLTHTQRWRAAHHTVGYGSLYQGRFKSFPIQRDDHFLIVCRYVERNALRANLVECAEHWRWSSLWSRQHPDHPLSGLLHDDWPVKRPVSWLDRVNEPHTAAELEALQTSIRRGRPFGDDPWQQGTAQRLGMEASLRPLGRPKNPQPDENGPRTLLLSHPDGELGAQA